MGTRGAITAMISGIDIALWDIRGQALGVPIYDLLGGKVREDVPLYTHFRPAQVHRRRMVESAGSATSSSRGSTAIKTDPFSHGRRRASSTTLHRRPDRAATSRTRRRDDRGHPQGGRPGHPGPDRRPRPLQRADRGPALAHASAPYDITWFEEPCRPRATTRSQQVRNQVPSRDLRRRAAAHALRVPAGPRAASWPTTSCRT